MYKGLVFCCRINTNDIFDQPSIEQRFHLRDTAHFKIGERDACKESDQETNKVLDSCRCPDAQGNGEEKMGVAKISRKLKRTIPAVAMYASKLGISLRTT